MTSAFLTRVRMELALPPEVPKPLLPDNFFWVPWDDALLSLHAEVHFRAFVDCIDRQLFASFQDRSSCYYLLNEIRHSPGFLPQATWLVGHPTGCCGTIQCVEVDGKVGAIQNVGVLPSFRGRGLGLAMILQALQSFKDMGLARASLEVTAENERAYRLYQRLGFVRKQESQRATLEALATSE